jgi:RNA polymerase sigma factor (sigma-70 family)
LHYNWNKLISTFLWFNNQNYLRMDNKKMNVLSTHHNAYFEVDNAPPITKETLENQIKTKLCFRGNQTLVVELLKQKNAFALSQLYDAYGATLYGVVLRIVSSKEIAEQVIQDTFVKIWHHAASYEASKGRLYTWMLNIARNTAIDATRTTQFQNHKNTANIDNLIHVFDEECLNLDTIGLREIVKTMDEKYTVLIDLIYFNQYTHIEAAEATGLPLGTVKTRVRYALFELKKIFASRGSL